MSTIGGTITHGITLGTSGAYASPLTITTAGYVQGAIYGPNTAAWIVDNAGKVLGVDLANGGSVTNDASGSNAGLIEGSASGVQIHGSSGTVINFGTIETTGTNGHGVVLVSGIGSGPTYWDSVTNASGALIAGAQVGIYIGGIGGSVSNSGTIEGTGFWGVQLAIATGLAAVTNQAGGLIEGADGTYIAGAGRIVNSGTIDATGPSGVGVDIHGGGSGSSQLTNASTGLIAGAQVGALITGGIGGATVSNSGTIDGTSGSGVYMGGGRVANYAGGVIAGVFGVQFALGPGTVTNSGIISGTADGVYLRGGGSVANSGTIDGGIGVYIDGGVGTISNTGNIGGGIGIDLFAGGLVINGAIGLIAGGVILPHGGSIANEGFIFGAQGGRIGAGSIGINLSSDGSIGNTGLIEGGSGASPSKGFGGVGAPGISLSGSGIIANEGVITGGRGGNGAGGSFSPTFVVYSGGAGGMGMTLSGRGAIANSGYIVGGSGGGGGSVSRFGVIFGSQGGPGGAGIVLSGGGSIINTGTIEGGGGGPGGGGFPSGASGGGIVLTDGGTIIDSGTISGATAITFDGTAASLLVLEQGYKLVGSALGSGTAGATNTVEISGSLGAVTVNYNALSLTNFQNVLFGPGGNQTLDVTNTSGMPGVTISGFALSSDIIDLTAIGTNGTITNDDTVNHLVTIAGSGGTVTLQLNASDGTSFTTISDGLNGTELIPCFCRDTLILTARGEVPVEALKVGDRVKTLSGAAKPVRWIGFGRDLVTAKNSLARPIIVRAGALADDVPRRDLYLTHGHALYLDGVLIPVENLVNHRSILWDDTARVVEYYHIELDEHDVVIANGAPAESYYDAGNRALFHNAREGFAAGAAQPTCAPVLTSGEIVEAIWAALCERAGGRRNADTSDDPDLHLVIDGERLDPTSVAEGVYSFTLAEPPVGPLLLSSRSAVPSLVGLNRHEHRRLGVAIRQIVLRGLGVMTCLDHDAPLFVAGGCHPAERGHSWTDGALALPAPLFAHLRGAFTLLVHTKRQAMRYPVAAALAKAA